MGKIGEKFLHFFTPGHTNNHRAKALHLSSITTYIAILLVFQIFLTGVSRFAPGVLGYASNITVSDLLKYTNEKRQAVGAGPVILNDQLNQAAQDKAQNMFAEGYWAHTSPSGKDPWSFILGAGYSYLFAGENLARDFGDSKSVVDAWMNSPAHKDNLINNRYRDIGFAVVNGKYGGYETTLVVQMFGTKPSGSPSVEPKESVSSSGSGAILNTSAPNIPKFKVDVVVLTKGLSYGIIGLLALVLVTDAVIVSRRKVVRLNGHNLAHLLFLVAILIAFNIIGRGSLI